MNLDCLSVSWIVLEIKAVEMSAIWNWIQLDDAQLVVLEGVKKKEV